MPQPLFSITTPCWNSVSTIERTILSILNQEFKDYEYIIVDGGSLDGTLDIIKKYEPLFEGRMKWKSESDKGLYDAFNKGINRSNGVFCWNINADDFIEPDALYKLANYINEHNWNELPIISGGMNFISEKGKILFKNIPSATNLKKSYENDSIGVSHPATIVPREIYMKYGGFDLYYKIIGDTDWFHRVYGAGVRFELIDFVIINMSDGGISNQFSYRRSLRDRLYYLRKFYSNPFVRFIHWLKWTRSFYIQKYQHYWKKHE